MAIYSPPHQVKTREIDYLSLVTRADPDHNRRKHREVEYEFRGGRRKFVGDPAVRGAYAPDDD